jgi:hypothetical protein
MIPPGIMQADNDDHDLNFSSSPVVKGRAHLGPDDEHGIHDVHGAHDVHNVHHAHDKNGVQGAHDVHDVYGIDGVQDKRNMHDTYGVHDGALSPTHSNDDHDDDDFVSFNDDDDFVSLNDDAVDVQQAFNQQEEKKIENDSEGKGTEEKETEDKGTEEKEARNLQLRGRTVKFDLP